MAVPPPSVVAAVVVVGVVVVAAVGLKLVCVEAPIVAQGGK
jgi:hypothetical protein